MQDLMNDISGAAGLVPGALITATAHGTAVDVTALNGGNNGCCFLVEIGAVTDGTHTLTLEDQVDGSTWVTVAAPYLQTPSGQSNVVNSSVVSGTILKFGYLGNPAVATLAPSSLSGAPAHKVLVRLTDTVTGSPSTGGYITSIAVLGFPFNKPAA